MKMKELNSNFTILSNCDNRYKCIYSSCCNLEILQDQFFLINIISLIVCSMTAVFLSFQIIFSKSRKLKNSEDGINNINNNINNNNFLNRSNSFINRSHQAEINLNMSASFSQNRQISQHFTNEL